MNQILIEDCPLCGAKHIIDQVSEHAKECPHLKDVLHPEDLLRYHLGILLPENRKNSHNLFEAYEEELHKIGLRIKYETVRVWEHLLSSKGPKWVTMMWIEQKSLTPESFGVRQLLVKTTLSHDDAWRSLMHRLLCGEVLKVYSTLKGIDRWQIEVKDNPGGFTIKPLN